MNVNEIVQNFLMQADCAGLINHDEECVCLVNDLCACGEIKGNCIAAYTHTDNGKFNLQEIPAPKRGA